MHYHYISGGKRYPPKYVICLAAKHAIGRELRFDEFNAVAARDYLRARGHIVIDDRDMAILKVQDESAELAFPEGAEKYVLHRRKERDTKMARLAKENRLADVGSLRCDVCGFDFEKTYGELGEGYIEAHHVIPVSELAPNAMSKVSDLALVCANCHRMLHRGKSTLSIEELREKIAQQRASRSQLASG